MGGICVFTAPIFRPHFSKTFFTLRRTVQGGGGPDTLLTDTDRGVWSWPWHFAYVRVCVFEWFRTDVSHVTYWRRWDVIHNFAALLFFKISSMRLPHKETENTPWWLQCYWKNGQWTWKDTRESGHSRCQITVHHCDWSMSYITTTTEQTETEPMSPNYRPWPHNWANLLYIYE